MRTRKAVVPKAEEEPGESSSSEANGPAPPSLSTCVAEQGRSTTSKAGRFCHKKYQHFAEGTGKNVYKNRQKKYRSTKYIQRTPFVFTHSFSFDCANLRLQVLFAFYTLSLVFRFYSYKCSFVCYSLFYFDGLFSVFSMQFYFAQPRFPSCLHLYVHFLQVSPCLFVPSAFACSSSCCAVFCLYCFGSTLFTCCKKKNTSLNILL